MPNERLGPPLPTPEAEFGFTEQEALFDRVSHRRFLVFLEDEATILHRVIEAANNYGEFLFVTMSRPGTDGRIYATFWGLGFHEYRERWLSQEWFWYFTNALPEDEKDEISKEEAQALLQERLAYVQAHATDDTQSRRGQLFEMLADFTDEDGAWAEMQDLPDWLLDNE